MFVLLIEIFSQRSLHDPKVYWIAPEALDTELYIGQMALSHIGIAAGHGRIKQSTEFKILDAVGFARFAECALLLSRVPPDIFELKLRLDSSNHSGGIYVAPQVGASPLESVGIHRYASFAEVVSIRNLSPP